MKAAIESLLQLGVIGEDWDGEGAAAPIPELIESALQLLRLPEFTDQLPIPSRVVPVNDGRIVLDFYLGKTYLSARIDSPGRARVMIVEPGQSPRFVSWVWSPAFPKVGWLH